MDILVNSGVFSRMCPYKASGILVQTMSTASKILLSSPKHSLFGASRTLIFSMLRCTSSGMEDITCAKYSSTWAFLVLMDTTSHADSAERFDDMTLQKTRAGTDRLGTESVVKRNSFEQTVSRLCFVGFRQGRLPRYIFFHGTFYMAAPQSIEQQFEEAMREHERVVNKLRHENTELRRTLEKIRRDHLKMNFEDIMFELSMMISSFVDFSLTS
jgi:hypothetical protein